jgi:tetratricopeptide (TPR) repeat protein
MLTISTTSCGTCSPFYKAERFETDMPNAAPLCPSCQAPLDSRVLGGLCPKCISGWMLADSPPVPLRDGVTTSGLPISRLGDYELLAELGRGGMGIVYRARQSSLDRIVALKLMHRSLSEDREHAARFLREARVAASLRHPGIVAIYDLGRLEGVPFFTMELVEGSSLEGLLADGPVAPARVAELVMIVAQSIAQAHEHGVVHRDLKPSNVLLDLDGRPKLADFGLAKDLSAHTPRGATQPGFLIGTPAHMAPEQAAGDTSGQPTVDIYGLGALMYHLLTGCAPHTATSLDAILRQIIDEAPLAPRTLVADVPAPIEAIVMRCLEKRPEARYASAREVAAELERFLSGQPVQAMGEGASRTTFLLDAASPRLRAYDLFLQAQRQHDDRGLLSDSMAEVETLLQDALRLDPRLARAHLLLCELHLANYFIGFDPSSARLRRAEAAMAVAESLGAEATELMRMRGFFLYWGRRDNAAAARAFEHAVRAMPNSADAIYNLALVHRRAGRWTKALAGFARAQELDPRNPRIARETAYTLEMVRDYAAALKVFRVQQVVSPGDPVLQSLVRVTQLCFDGDLDAAVAEFTALPSDPDGIVAKWRALFEAWRGRRRGAGGAAAVARTGGRRLGGGVVVAGTRATARRRSFVAADGGARVRGVATGSHGRTRGRGRAIDDACDARGDAGRRRSGRAPRGSRGGVAGGERRRGVGRGAVRRAIDSSGAGPIARARAGGRVDGRALFCRPCPTHQRAIGGRPNDAAIGSGVRTSAKGSAVRVVARGSTGAARSCAVNQRWTLRHFVNLDERDAAGVVRAADLEGVGAGTERHEQSTVGAAFGEREGADAVGGVADISGIDGGAPRRVGPKRFAAGVE